MIHDIETNPHGWLRDLWGLNKLAKTSLHLPMADRYDEIERARKIRRKRKIDKKLLYKKKAVIKYRAKAKPISLENKFNQALKTYKKNK